MKIRAQSGAKPNKYNRKNNMKKLILFTVVAAALALATGKAAASAFNISGTAVFNYTNYIKGTNYIAKTATMSINNAFIYNWISNAVANATNGLATNLPARGYLVYFPLGSDGKYNGYFYVTDTKDFYYPLSGLDTNNDHYSFMELNTYDKWFGILGRGDCCCCCCDDSNSVYTASNSIYMTDYSLKTGFGSYSAIDTAQISIHYYPYWDDTNDPIRLSLTGTFDPKLTLKYDYPYSPSTATFSGIGHVDLTEGLDHWRGVIPGVTAKFNF